MPGRRPGERPGRSGTRNQRWQSRQGRQECGGGPERRLLSGRHCVGPPCQPGCRGAPCTPAPHPGTPPAGPGSSGKRWQAPRPQPAPPPPAGCSWQAGGALGVAVQVRGRRRGGGRLSGAPARLLPPLAAARRLPPPVGRSPVCLRLCARCRMDPPRPGMLRAFRPVRLGAGQPQQPAGCRRPRLGLAAAASGPRGGASVAGCSSLVPSPQLTPPGAAAPARCCWRAGLPFATRAALRCRSGRRRRRRPSRCSRCWPRGAARPAPTRRSRALPARWTTQLRAFGAVRDQPRQRPLSFCCTACGATPPLLGRLAGRLVVAPARLQLLPHAACCCCEPSGPAASGRRARGTLTHPLLPCLPPTARRRRTPLCLVRFIRLAVFRAHYQARVARVLGGWPGSLLLLLECLGDGLAPCCCCLRCAALLPCCRRAAPHHCRPPRPLNCAAHTFRLLPSVCQVGEPLYPPSYVSFQVGPSPWALAPPTLKFIVAATGAGPGGGRRLGALVAWGHCRGRRGRRAVRRRAGCCSQSPRCYLTIFPALVTVAAPPARPTRRRRAAVLPHARGPACGAVPASQLTWQAAAPARGHAGTLAALEGCLGEQGTACCCC